VRNSYSNIIQNATKASTILIVASAVTIAQLGGKMQDYLPATRMSTVEVQVIPLLAKRVKKLRESSASLHVKKVTREKLPSAGVTALRISLSVQIYVSRNKHSALMK
jgi:hypothetical protein